MTTQVQTGLLADGAVTAPKMADGAVTAPKMAADSVGTTNLVGGAVTAPKLADNTVGTAKLVDGSVTNAKISDASVSPAKLSAGAPVWTAGGNLQFNSGYGSAAVAFGCRAWVNFNGTGVPAIRASGNVTSITNNGVGDYAINFAANMPDANYAISGLTGDPVGNGTVKLKNGVAPTISSAIIQTVDHSGTVFDPAYVTAMIVR